MGLFGGAVGDEGAHNTPIPLHPELTLIYLSQLYGGSHGYST